MMDFLPLVTGAIGGATSAGVFKGPLQTLNDLWFNYFGQQTHEKRLKYEALIETNTEKYKQEIALAISKIDPNNIKEPALNILGPTLEASKFYISDEEIQKMFANLLASSMDKTKDTIVHNSFVELIKQLSPLDAQNLMLLKIHTQLPIAEVRAKTTSNPGGYQTLITNFFLDNTSVTDINVIGSSVDNLRRLGLVNITYTEYLVSLNDSDDSENLYSKFETSEVFTKMKTMIQTAHSTTPSEGTTPFLDAYAELREPEIMRGIIKLTPFGTNFCNICI